jgi:uncharacterized lipoprotein YddW (UPF0748 family)
LFQIKNMKCNTFLLFFILLIGLKNSNAQNNIIPPKTEFRGVWIATVANIDWPLNKTDSIAKQKQDYIALLDYYKKINFNAVIVQIRTSGDAFYETDLAPW